MMMLIQMFIVRQDISLVVKANTDKHRVIAFQAPPVAFRICRESREVASKAYWIKGAPELRRFYPKIDPSIDTVLCRYEFNFLKTNILHLPCFTEKEQEAIQFLAVERWTWGGSDEIQLVKFKNLKSLSFVSYVNRLHSYFRNQPRVEFFATRRWVRL
jgi:hypothetical protein